MNIFKGIIDNFPVYYEGEKYSFIFFDCDSLKKIVDRFNLGDAEIEFYVDNLTIRSEKISNISGTFIIGKIEKMTTKFPYPFILDYDCPILIEATNGNVTKFEYLTDLVSKIKKDFAKENKDKSKEIYRKLCSAYGEQFINEILPYEDVLYYFD